MSEKDFEDGVLLGMYYGTLSLLGDMMKAPRYKIEEGIDFFAKEHNIEHTPERAKAFQNAVSRMQIYGKDFVEKHPETRTNYQDFKTKMGIPSNSPKETIDLRGLKIDEETIKKWAEENEKEAKDGVKDDPK